MGTELRLTQTSPAPPCDARSSDATWELLYVQSQDSVLTRSTQMCIQMEVEKPCSRADPSALSQTHLDHFRMI